MENFLNGGPSPGKGQIKKIEEGQITVASLSINKFKLLIKIRYKI